MKAFSKALQRQSRVWRALVGLSDWLNKLANYRDQPITVKKAYATRDVFFVPACFFCFLISNLDSRRLEKVKKGNNEKHYLLSMSGIYP